mmetsp:Transcript_19056/g.35144  ORF Transcript_19056/g.35144 Transcript_19056/m.35144 type:complete len:290 (-) Transcript_19056:2377-3246(-)
MAGAEGADGLCALGESCSCRRGIPAPGTLLSGGGGDCASRTALAGGGGDCSSRPRCMDGGDCSSRPRCASCREPGTPCNNPLAWFLIGAPKADGGATAAADAAAAAGVVKEPPGWLGYTAAWFGYTIVAPGATGPCVALRSGPCWPFIVLYIRAALGFRAGPCTSPGIAGCGETARPVTGAYATARPVTCPGAPVGRTLCGCKALAEADLCRSTSIAPIAFAISPRSNPICWAFFSSISSWRLPIDVPTPSAVSMYSLSVDSAASMEVAMSLRCSAIREFACCCCASVY